MIDNMLLKSLSELKIKGLDLKEYGVIYVFVWFFVNSF